MTTRQGLQQRIAASGATCVHLGKPPAWFAKVAKAATGAPVVVNCNGVSADDTPVVITLAELERLQAAAART